MVKLDPLQAFVEVVRAGGFSAAERRTRIPRSTLSLHMKALEAALGVRLLKRSTRAIALTGEGARLYEQAGEALDTLAKAMDGVRNTPNLLRGVIRLTAPSDFPTGTLAAALTGFKHLHPGVSFELLITNDTLNLIRDNVDMAIRIGTPASMDAVERHLLDIEWGFFASVAWLKTNGFPESVEAVRDFISPRPLLRAFLEKNLFEGRPLPPASIEVDNHLLARDLIIAGFGTGFLPVGLCSNAVTQGIVKPLLPSAGRPLTRLVVTFPTRSDVVPRVKAFTEYLAHTLAA